MKILQFIIDLLKKFFTKDMSVSTPVESEKPVETTPVKNEGSVECGNVPKKGNYSEAELLLLQKIIDSNLEGDDLSKAIEKASYDLNRPIKNLKTKIKNMKRS